MAYRVFILSRRLDVQGMNVQVLDLKPNTSQKNGVYDGEGQTFYMNTMDYPGTTHEIENAWVSGSKFTTILVGGYDAALDDTTGGGDDVMATPRASFGLAAYLRERVQPGGIPLAIAGRMTPANAMTLAMRITSALDNGGGLDIVSINAILSAGLGSTAQTDLDGASGFSKSFGSVMDIMRILDGEIYRSPIHAIICNQLNQFRSLAERNILVAAQDIVNNGGTTFVAEGDFLTNTENGYVKIPNIALTGEVFASAGGGYLHKLADGVAFKNPNFAYTAADVTPFKPRAIAWDGTVIPESGLYPVLRVYMQDGTCLL